MFDCVAVVWTALSSAVWLSRLAASEWMTCFYAVMLSWLPSPECITQCCVTSLPPVLVYLLWIAWCLAVSLSCVATPDVDGPVFDCVAVVCIAGTGVDFLVIGCVAVSSYCLGEDGLMLGFGLPLFATPNHLRLCCFTFSFCFPWCALPMFCCVAVPCCYHSSGYPCNVLHCCPVLITFV
jgi:hypothetical protein